MSTQAQKLILQKIGANARKNRFSILFTGINKTAKTIGAELLAGNLERDLYRVDLSTVVSKYIGETEKNLRRLFAAAESQDAVLFLDEADALFGKRSDVNDAHDRYANIEINYLLRKMETYRGIAILATDPQTVLDETIRRHFRFVVDFC